MGKHGIGFLCTWDDRLNGKCNAEASLVCSIALGASLHEIPCQRQVAEKNPVASSRWHGRAILTQEDSVGGSWAGVNSQTNQLSNCKEIRGHDGPASADISVPCRSGAGQQELLAGGGPGYVFQNATGCSPYAYMQLEVDPEPIYLI